MFYPRGDYYISCDICRKMHLKSQMYQQMEDAVPAHINDERSTCYNICKWCMGDRTILLE
jgi:hypothetical protein